MTLAAYEITDGAYIETIVPSPSGERAAQFLTRRSGDTLAVHRSGPLLPWNVQVVGEVVAVPADESECRVRLP